MTKYTQGEWEQSGCSVYSKGTAKPICLMSGPAEQKERLANARLISAAPELLEACKEMMNLLRLQEEAGRPVDSREARKRAEEAIAKAE